MKKILAIFLALTLLFSCVACTKTEEQSTVSDGSSSAVSSSDTDNSSTVSDDAVVSDGSNSDDQTSVDETDTPDASGDNSTPTETPSEDDEIIETPSEEEDEIEEPVEDDPTIPVNPGTGEEGCSHVFYAATCKAPQTCSKCGATKGNVGSHKYTNATCTEPSKCKTCGKTIGKEAGHKFVLGECTNKINGKICGAYDSSYISKLYITGDMSQITDPKQTSKKIECNVNFEYRGRGQQEDGTAKIKIQGSSSTRYAKKNYTINFYEDSNYSSKQKIDVGWGAQSKYCLKANWIDKTHSRNIVSAKLASEMQDKYDLFTTAPHNGTIDGFPVAIYINGEFHGLYTMNIPKDEWMFGMDKNNPNHIVLCGENWNDPVLFKSVPNDLNDWTVEAGPEDDATLQKLQRLVDFVLNSSDEEFKKNFSQYLNLDSTLNYYIMMGYAWASDNTGKNMLLATYDGKVWYPTLYDLDSTWGMHWTGDYEVNYSNGVINGSNSVLWQRFEKAFKKEIAARYFELRATVLDPEHVMNAFQTFYASIPQEALDLEKAKWETAETPIPGSDLAQIKRYLDVIVPRLDARYAAWL